jgi:hypothetical protein
MFLPLLCLGTILAPTCPASCSQLPLSGPVGWTGSTLLAALRRPLRGPAPQPRFFTIRVGSQDKVVAVSHLKVCTASYATPGSQCCRGRLPGSRPGDLATTKLVSFSDPLVSSPSPSLAPPRDGSGTVFLPGEEIFERPGLAAS